MQLLRKFYFDLVPTLSTSAMNASSLHIDSSIGSAIKNSSSIKITKVIENGVDRSEFTNSTAQIEEGVKKSINLWPNFKYFGTESCDVPLRGQIYQKTPFFMSTRATNHAKMEKRSITQTFLSLHKSCCSPTNQQMLSLTCSKRTRSKFWGLGTILSAAIF